MKFSVVVLSAALAASSLYAQTKPAGTAKPKPAASKAKAASSAAKPTAAPKAAAAKPEGKVVLRVGNESMTATEFDNLIEGLPEQVRAQARGPMKRQVAEQVIRLKLLAQEARKKGLDKEKSMQARIQFQTENLLAGAAYNDIQQNTKVDEPALRKYFEEHKGEYQKVAARHILIKFNGSPVPQREGKPELSEEQALEKVQELRKKLVAGGDFAAIAKAESDDTGSGENGGELGTFGRGQMVPDFEKVAFSLPVGQVSEPVKTQFGYHLIRVDKQENKGFDEVRSEIEGKLKPEMAGDAVEKLRKDATVTIDDAYFGPATPAPAAAGPGAPPPTPAPAK
jgi:parvulin-like peptidyl-prolyl isomerase